MLRWLYLLMVKGQCPSCGHKDAELSFLREQVSELQDRLMSRDFASYTFAKAQGEQIQKQTELLGKENGRRYESPDGLD